MRWPIYGLLALTVGFLAAVALYAIGVFLMVASPAVAAIGLGVIRIGHTLAESSLNVAFHPILGPGVLVGFGIYLAMLISAVHQSRSGPEIEHARDCEGCGAETFQFERCHECGDVPWKGYDR